nr:MAG TPA: hypothetical protein [Herelleviridae sp.]
MHKKLWGRIKFLPHFSLFSFAFYEFLLILGNKLAIVYAFYNRRSSVIRLGLNGHILVNTIIVATLIRLLQHFIKFILRKCNKPSLIYALYNSVKSHFVTP